MKTKVLKWALAVFGIGLVAFFACKPSEEGYEGPLEFAVLQSGDYAGGQLVTDYYTVCRDYESYAEMWSRLSLPGEPEPMNFNAYSVLCVVDTLRPFPMYRIGVAGVNQTEDYVEVQVERTVDARVGSPVQAYALVRVPRISKDVKCVNLPFETGIVDPYMPELGTSECLMIAKEEYPEETFWFKFTEEGKLLIERRNVWMNCAETTLEASVTQDGEKLAIKEEEVFPDDRYMACECSKYAAYETDVVVSNDSLTVELYTSTSAITRTAIFKIPGHGSGEIVVRDTEVSYGK